MSDSGKRQDNATGNAPDCQRHQPDRHAHNREIGEQPGDAELHEHPHDRAVHTRSPKAGILPLQIGHDGIGVRARARSPSAVLPRPPNRPPSQSDNRAWNDPVVFELDDLLLRSCGGRLDGWDAARRRPRAHKAQLELCRGRRSLDSSRTPTASGPYQARAEVQPAQYPDRAGQ